MDKFITYVGLMFTRIRHRSHEPTISKGDGAEWPLGIESGGSATRVTRQNAVAQMEACVWFVNQEFATSMQTFSRAGSP